MSKVLFGLAGEGRGHAMRAHTIIESLRKRHRVLVRTHGQAYDMLEPIYRESSVDFRRIPGLRFRYDADRKLNYAATFLGIAPYMWDFLGNVADMARSIEADEIDLVITDFEPLVAWGAKRADVPFVSLDHQHFITVCDFSGLPAALRMRVALMAPFVDMHYSGQVETIVSGFAFPPLRRGVDAVQVGVLLRDEIVNAEPEHGPHITAYIRRLTDDAVLNALSGCGRQVRIYGLGRQPDRGTLRFKQVDPHGFVEDLATGEALVTTAGNQLVGESLFLGKPVLALPEPGNFEQHLNGYLLEQSGAGAIAAAELLESEDVIEFLSRIEEYRSRIDRKRLYGNPVVLSILNSYLDRVPSEGALAA